MLELMKESLSYPLPKIQVANLEDETLADAGIINQDKVRSIMINEWRIDQTVETLVLPRSLMDQLGINHLGLVRLRIQNTEVPIEVREIPDSTFVLLGRMPLEFFDRIS